MSALAEAPPDTWGLAAKLYRISDDGDTCFRAGCDATAIVALTFLANAPHDGEDATIDEGFVTLCRTHLHGFLGYFLDNSDPIPADAA